MTFANGPATEGGQNGDLTTVVIPARNEASFIAQCLESVISQDEPRLAIVVVDGSSDDSTREIASRFAQRDPRVKLLTTEKISIPGSLNTALAATQGEWFIRVDAHSTISPGYVRGAIDHLRTNRWGGVGGRKEAVGTTAPGRAIASALGSRFGVGNSVYHHGSSLQTVDHIPFGAYPTALVRELGGWDERVFTNEDYEFDFRVRSSGRDLLFDPRLVISWHCRQSIGELFRQYLRYGAGKATVARLHPESMRPRHCIPPAFVAVLMTALATVGRRRGPLIAVTLPYVGGLAIACVSASRNLHDARARAWLPLVFPTMHLAWGFGFWQGIGSMLLHPGWKDKTAYVNPRWQIKTGLGARVLGRIKERKDPAAPRLAAPKAGQSFAMESRPIFVVGCQRSGTSLLRRILDSHSSIACPPESQFILPLVEILQGNTASDRDKYLNGLESMGFGRAEVETSLAGFISGFFDAYKESQRKKRWADKSPLYVDCLPELWDLFGPSAQFIVIIRHGMDVAFSLSQAHRDYAAIREHVADAHGNVAVGAARFWADQNAKIESFRAARPDACLRLRYEELTTDPVGCLQPMFEWLGEAWEPEVVEYSRFSHHRGFEDPEVRRRTRIEPNSGRYRAWPPPVQSAVRAECQPMLLRLGYE